MALSYRVTNGTTYVRVARDCNHGSSYVGSVAYGMAHRDNTLEFLLQGAFRSGWHPISKYARAFPVSPVATDASLKGFAPHEPAYDGHVDHLRYGTGLSALVASMRVLRGASPSSFSEGNQHDVEHASYRGSLGPNFGSDAFIVGPQSRPRAFLRYLDNDQRSAVHMWPFTPPLEGSGYSAIDVGLSYPAYSFTPVGGVHAFGSYYPSFAFSDVVKRIKEAYGSTYQVSEGRYGPHTGSGYSWTLFISGFSAGDPESDVCEITYHMRWEVFYYSTGVNHSIDLDVRHVVDRTLYFLEPNHHLSNGERIYTPGISGGISFNSEYTCTSKTAGPINDWFHSELHNVGGKLSFAVPLGTYYFCSSPILSDSSVDAMNIPRFISRNYLASFRTAVSNAMPDIRCSSFQSSSDALDHLTQTIDTNLVETFAEIRDVAEMLPQLGSAIAAVRRLKGGDVLGSIKETLDFLTALRLQASFAWTPSLELLRDTLPEIVRLSSTISSLSAAKLVRGYGTMSYEFPEGEFGRETSHLVARSMVIVRSDPQSTVQDLLGIRKYGLLPSPSSLWDLVPLSFVVDWFTGVGSRIRTLESISLLAMMDVQSYTHTYLIRSPLTANELDKDGLRPSSNEGSSQPELRLFIREISQHVPAPRSGRYDFAMPGQPPWLTAASLAWQIFAR